MVAMDIRVDDLSSSEVAELLSDHLQNMRLHSPLESIHALDLNALRQRDITFWCVWENGELLGCGALKELAYEHAEIKSMKTSIKHLRKGVASHMLRYILAEAEKRTYRRVSLETGSMEAFVPARQLYAKFGFKYCQPFAGYIKDPNSVFMTKEL